VTGGWRNHLLFPRGVRGWSMNVGSQVNAWRLTSTVPIYLHMLIIHCISYAAESWTENKKANYNDRFVAAKAYR
jgi:hypothetical protein